MRRISLCKGLALTLCLLAPLAAQPAAAGETRADADYYVTVSGFRIGKLQLKSAYAERAYTIRGQGRITGIAGAFVDFSGETKSTGMIGRNGLSPAEHDITYNTARLDFITAMSFAGGQVKSIKAEPALKPKDDRIEVRRSHLSGVIDPISALVIRVPGTDSDTEKKVCARTLNIFDGRERYDLPMSYAGSDSDKVPGFSGDLVKCDVRYKPIAGHRTSNDFVNDMATRTGIQAWFARVPGTDLFLFYRAVIPTGFGVVEVRAAELNLGAETKQAAN